MMKRILIVFLIINAFVCWGQDDTISIETKSNYLNWGWDAITIKNSYITASFVPSMGGNMLQYDFGVDTFLILNPSTFGNTYDPNLNQSPFEESWGFGGFQTWPTPEVWPPPSILTWGNYSDSILFITPDSVCLQLQSDVQAGFMKGLKYIKTIKAYKYSTCIRIENRIINTSNSTLIHGLMNVAEVIVQHQQQEDYSNFNVYFPIQIGGEEITISPTSKAFIGETYPGIFEMEYTPQRGKIYSNSPFGWISYIDQRDSHGYFCIYNLEENAEYPDFDANLEVYVESAPSFMALEAISPIVELAPNGGSYSFTENFYSTKINGMILKANHSGAVSTRLKYDTISSTLTGKFGVFQNGKVRLLYYNLENVLLEMGEEIAVNPLNDVNLIYTSQLPAGTNLIELVAYNDSGLKIGIIDYFDFSEPILSENKIKTRTEKFKIVPTILTEGQNVNYSLFLDKASIVSITIMNQNSQVVKQNRIEKISPGEFIGSIDLTGIKAGVYFIVFNDQSTSIVQKLIIY